jgi:hypothetical protein
VGAEDAAEGLVERVVVPVFALVVALVGPEAAEREADDLPEVDGAWNDCPERLAPEPVPADFDEVRPDVGAVPPEDERLPEVGPVAPVVPDTGEDDEDDGSVTGWLQPVASAGAGLRACAQTAVPAPKRTIIATRIGHRCRRRYFVGAASELTRGLPSCRSGDVHEAPDPATGGRGRSAEKTRSADDSIGDPLPG